MASSAGHALYSHMVVYLLLVEAKGSVAVTSDLKIESVALRFARAVLLNSMRALGSLLPVQNLVLCQSCLPLTTETLDYCDKELQILSPLLVSEALAARTWLSSKGLVLTGAPARSLRFLTLFCLETWLSTDGQF